ncbi:LuxR family transcriptional regulator [Actinoplanes sp. OR16]|uniref:helix-turn-helix transcriptional regulator n=1 Tax=Actinoplanes sp. OR16 TaxID=946334 RepID=UPI000F6DE79B|nr:LuxR family transcriptional regulator [Actinoplanes sp. OR16]BBH68196.1 LuxR family transcriptional regulator [Actinoplanes sp. OR16]
MPFTQLIGRDGELDRISRAGQSLHLTGDRGSGKSALLTAAAGAAREAGRRVLVLRGGPGPWPLRQLLLAVRHDLSDLPSPVRGPAHAFLGLDPELPPPPENELPEVVRAAIAAVARTTPILIVADDIQDLDPAALTTVTTLAGSPRITVLTAGRSTPGTAQAGRSTPGTTQAGRSTPGTAQVLQPGTAQVLHLEPLGPEDAARLLDGRHHTGSARDRATILHRAAGNPAALIELADPGSPAGGLLAEFTDATAWLPDRSRTLLLYAAAAGFPTEATRLSALTTAVASDWDPAVEAGLITIDDGVVRFGHPLAAEAAYRSASAHLRRRVHRDLADAFGDRPERRALQLAAAESGPDERIATELERAAAIFRRRGDRYEATAAMQQAAERTPSSQSAARRLTQAVADARDLRDTGWTAELYAQVWRLTDDPDVLAAAARPAAIAMHWAGRLHEAYGIVTAAHRAGPPANPADSAQLALIAAQIAWVTCDDDHRQGLPPLLAAAGDDADPAIAAYVREVMAPARHAGRDLLETVAVPAPETVLLPADRHRLGLIGAIATAEDRAQLAAGLLSRTVDSDAAPGFGVLPTLVGALIDTGDWERAQTLTDPGRTAGLPAMRVTLAAMRALLHALRGEHEAATRLARETWERLDIQGNRAAHVRLLRASGLASADGGDQENGYRYLRMMFDLDGRPLHPYLSSRSVAELAITAVRCGQQNDARTVVARVREAAGADPSPRMVALLHLSDAVLAGADADEESFRTAAAENGYPYEHALANLHYGVWLRRRRSPREARLLLTYAEKIFSELGAESAAGLAAREIAVGAQSATPQDDGVATLTPQERQVAALAAQGLSNRAIAEKLFLSARTVGTHLSRVYRKTGISRRHQLGNLS